MRWLLHDWSDEESIAILNNLKKVATPKARVMLVESVVPETPEFDMGKWMDLNMMVMATGRERTAAEFRELLDQAGFELEEIVATPSPLSIGRVVLGVFNDPAGNSVGLVEMEDGKAKVP